MSLLPFQEVQWVRNVAWGWGLLGVFAVFFFAIGLYRRVAWVPGGVVLLLFAWFMWVGRMTVEVDRTALSVHQWPIKISRVIPIKTIKNYQPVYYHPIQEYGGWGYRISPRGVAYSVDGDQGVQLELDSGERVLIGSPKPERIVAAIRQAIQEK